MVEVITWIYLLMLFPFFLFSSEFIASVNSNEVNTGDGFTLTLTLKEASAKASPFIDSLKQSFLIHSEQQFSNTTIVNNNISTSHSWSYMLMPKIAGEVQIPAIGIKTSEGEIFTQPITMRVVERKRGSSGQSQNEILLSSEVSNLRPYKNEPFILTVRLTSKSALANVKMDKFEIEGAILEPVGEPVVFEKIENGVVIGIIEFKYLVTPLKTGTLNIPSIVVQGGIPQKRNSRSIFHDHADSFGFMQGLVHLQPFAMTTEEKQIEIRSPAVDQASLPPAKALSLQEIWDNSQKFQEGEVFSRSFIISAEGIHSSQLPSLVGKLDQSGLFKVYADKPEFKDEIKDGKLKSSRIEHYTLIPQKSGELVLPEISVNFWDTEWGEKRNTRISARTLEVLPAVVPLHLQNQEVALLDLKTPKIEETRESPLKEDKTHLVLYALLGGLGVALIAAVVFLVLTQRKMKLLLKKEPLSCVKREELDELNPT